MVNIVNSVPEKALTVSLSQFRATGDISMRRVGEAAGVSATALYHHFANKQALLDAIADQAFSTFEKRLRSTTETDPVQIIRDILDEYRRFAKEEPNLFRLMFVEERASARKFPADFAAHRSPVFNLLWKAMADWMATTEGSGETEGPEKERVANLDNEPATRADESFYAAHDIWALAHGLIVLSQAGRFSDDHAFRVVFERSVDGFLARL